MLETLSRCAMSAAQQKESQDVEQKLVEVKRKKLGFQTCARFHGEQKPLIKVLRSRKNIEKKESEISLSVISASESFPRKLIRKV